MAHAHGYHFGGPVLGPLAIILAVPAVCYFLVYSCNKQARHHLHPDTVPLLTTVLAKEASEPRKEQSLVLSQGCLTLYGGVRTPGWPADAQFWSWNAAGVYVGYLALQIILHLVLPGKRDKGVVLRDGKRLEYKLTGKYNLLVTLLVVFYFSFYRKLVDLSWIYDNFLSLLTTAYLFSFLLSLGLYWASFRRGVLTALGGDTESSFYNFFIGRELNPRVGSFDLKHFIELYPGLIGWLLIDIGMLAKQHQNLGHVTNTMWLVVAFHGIYVADALWMEPAILTTMDITSDGLGWMLSFGNLTWVPFTYCLQARYLVDFPHVRSKPDPLSLLGRPWHATQKASKEDHLTQVWPLSAFCLIANWAESLKTLSWVSVGGICALNALGYLIFRASNNQKNLFRRDRNHPWVKQLKTLKTERGTELIVSGWWGISRHINYFGDWLLAWSWCLPCGLDHIVPYFYVIYFGILLAHRERRDDRACRQKHGKDWEKYCAEVRSRIIPMIY